MNIKEIIPIIKGFSLQQIPISVCIQLSDLIGELESIGKTQLQQIQNIPLKLELGINEIRKLKLDQDVISTEVSLSSNSEKKHIPNIDQLLLDLVLPYDIIEQKIQLSLPQLKTKIESNKILNTVINPILRQILQTSEVKLENVIQEKLNPILREPSKLMGLLNGEQELILGDIVRQMDYEIHNLNIENDDQNTSISCALSISTLNDFQKINQIKSLFKLDKSQLIPLILDKINSDIKSKVEQDVSLTQIKVLKTNTLLIYGKATAMKVQKEFEIETKIIFDKIRQEISLNVLDLKIEGGFLVRKGFNLVKPKIKSMIESTAIVSLKELLDTADLPIFSVDELVNYKLTIASLRIHSIELDSDTDVWNLEVEIDSGTFEIKRNSKILN